MVRQTNKTMTFQMRIKYLNTFVSQSSLDDKNKLI